MWSSTLIDELGYLPFEPHAAHLFFQLVSRRYERGSILNHVEPFCRRMGRGVRRRGGRHGDTRPAAAPQSRVDDYRRELPIAGEASCGRPQALGADASRPAAEDDMTMRPPASRRVRTPAIALASPAIVQSGPGSLWILPWRGKTRALRSAATEPSSRARLPHHLDGADAAHRTHRQSSSLLSYTTNSRERLR